MFTNIVAPRLPGSHRKSARAPGVPILLPKEARGEMPKAYKCMAITLLRVASENPREGAQTQLTQGWTTMNTQQDARKGRGMSEDASPEETPSGGRGMEPILDPRCLGKWRWPRRRVLSETVHATPLTDLLQMQISQSPCRPEGVPGSRILIVRHTHGPYLVPWAGSLACQSSGPHIQLV